MDHGITFVGTGEAFDPELPNTSLLYRGEHKLLLDCGYSIPHAFWKVCRDPSFLDGIYISHQHADHSFGLPALLLWMRLMGRKRALKIMGGPGLEGWLKRLLDLAYPGSFAPEKTFPIQVEVIQPNQIYSWGDTEFHTAVSRHSVRNCSLRIHANTGVVCYSGDGAPSAETEALFQGSDLLVHECYSDATPMDTHASAEYLIPMAERLGIASLYLLHLGVEYKDDVVRRVGSWTGNTRVHLPFPGQKVDLGQDTGFDPS